MRQFAGHSLRLTCCDAAPRSSRAGPRPSCSSGTAVGSYPAPQTDLAGSILARVTCNTPHGNSQCAWASTSAMAAESLWSAPTKPKASPRQIGAPSHRQSGEAAPQIGLHRQRQAADFKGVTECIGTPSGWVLSPPRALPSSAAAEDEEPCSHLAKISRELCNQQGTPPCRSWGYSSCGACRLAQQPGRHCCASALDGKPGEMLV